MDQVIETAHQAMKARDWPRLRLLLHPYLHYVETDGRVIRGRSKVTAMLQNVGAPSMPSSYELRDGQIYRWVE